VIDADYRGPVGVILFNFGDEPFEIKQGDRIAQLILEQIITPQICQVDDLTETERGAGGFGSTGVAKEDDTSSPDHKKQRTISPVDGEGDGGEEELSSANIENAPADKPDP